MIALAGIYPASLNVFDQNGNPVNANTVALTITLPDGTVLTPGPILNPATGQYTYSYLTTEPGRHTVRWVTTVPNTAYTDVFDVSEAVSPSIISLADIKQSLGFAPTYTADDQELREKLAAMTKAIENYKHEVIAQREITEEHFFGSLWGPSWVLRTRMRLLKVPVIALLDLRASDQSTVWDVTQMDVTADTGLVAPITGPPIRGRVTATYLAGYQIIPYNYIEAAKLLFQAVWETRRGPGGLSGVIGPEELADYRHYTALPRKVQEWLGPPRPIVM